MNILRINSNYPFNLSSSQKEKCGTECIAYVSPTDIKVTTCGTRIFADNVFPQKQECKIIEKVNSSYVDVYAKIPNEDSSMPSQTVLSTAHKNLLDNQKIFDFCRKMEVSKDKKTIEWSECKHVKLFINNEDITIAK